MLPQIHIPKLYHFKMSLSLQIEVLLRCQRQNKLVKPYFSATAIFINLIGHKGIQRNHCVQAQTEGSHQQIRDKDYQNNQFLIPDI